MTTPHTLLQALLADAARPRLTWYDGAERVELSARVLTNWVAKAGNLLQEEAGLAPGDVVRLDLPAGHWRSLYWALATWTCGGCLDLGAAPDALVHVAADSSALADSPADTRVLITPAALARRCPTPVPVGVIDEAAELATYGDVWSYGDLAAPALPALMADGTTVTYAELVGPPAAGPRRVHLPAATPAGELYAGILATWAAGGSVVLTGETRPDALARILASEGVDA